MYKFNVLFQPISSLTHVSNSPAKLQEREEFVRESWVKAMEARLVRDELVKCHRLEGVNHLENCRWLSDKYISMLKENKVKGYKKIDF
ncbi:NADH-ubiquinone oxidoreductase 12 kda subunit mitochondrial precursor [Suillus fuscotomentosus]|uniref:NADH-ubiquinone oxidoreductase 12 kDa subunit mitochondrial n=1 Tax=Suillus fuscotomentosus TaxID=1912939 RepID=A0AAD4E463_9AGAM|nr:NADH-ubiquinone oxidoreductase 12 kda subunit mitochondrial precursor [Suillus fuscotomentosus]KAG1825126.1 NADH-ubiquinone oxidoreductase 12 kda subunit mitochondrial precursor [Suillus variegatus]KAG1899408.1 NADH-ubiquinone oxidoreductase 12 kda subunit mitochondrial precursor [Suillus fuscotomentosus]